MQEMVPVGSRWPSERLMALLGDQGSLGVLAHGSDRPRQVLHSLQYLLERDGQVERRDTYRQVALLDVAAVSHIRGVDVDCHAFVGEGIAP